MAKRKFFDMTYSCRGEEVQTDVKGQGEEAPSDVEGRGMGKCSLASKNSGAKVLSHVEVRGSYTK